jgi:hypothetical protein
MKRFFLAALITCSAPALFAQIDLGMPSATGKGGAATALLRNFDAIGINPSALGWYNNYRLSVGVFNFGLAAQSKALDMPSLRKAITSPNDTFTTAQKNEYVRLFSDPQGLNLQAHLAWASASVFFPKLGGIAVNVRDRTFGHVGLNHNAADIIFNGRNAAVFQDTNTYHKTIGQLLDSTNISYLHYRELNIAYGRRLFATGDDLDNGEKTVQVFGGVGFKLLWGFGNIDARAENNTLTGHASFSNDYSINYGAIQNFTPQSGDLLFHAVGKGTAIDLGTTIILNGKIRIAVAATDIGSITWTNNQLLTTDTTMTPPDTSNTGINSWNLGSQSSYVFSSNGLFNYTPGPDFKSKLPSRLRIGYGMKIGRIVEVGADAVIPMNDVSVNLAHPYFAFGGEVNIAGFVKLSTGVSGNADWGWSVPFGATVGLGGFVEVSAATGDVLSYFAKSDNPMLSVAVLAVRFNLKKLTQDTSSPKPPVPSM